MAAPASHSTQPLGSEEDSAPAPPLSTPTSALNTASCSMCSTRPNSWLTPMLDIACAVGMPAHCR